LKTAKNDLRLSPFTDGIKPFYSRFRPYNVALPTVGMIDLGMHAFNTYHFFKHDEQENEDIGIIHLLSSIFLVSAR
jgi:hypothetical protein